MSNWNNWAEKIYDIIANSSYDYRYRTEEILENIFDAILIFIDYEDCVKIVKEQVYPKVCKLVHSPNDTHWVTYLERKIKEWESFYS